MDGVTILDDLYRYNDWAYQRLWTLCEGLTDTQLDEPVAMGFGSLRATFFHLLAAEQVWLERWRGVPWRPFPMQPQGESLSQIREELQAVAQGRADVMDAERADDWRRIVTFKDSRGHEYTHRLKDLLIHVANHGVYHRAQALNLLKRFGRTLPGGIDYIFFRLARPIVAQEPAAAESLRQFGLEVATGPGASLAWDRELIDRYFNYHDWAIHEIMTRASSLDHNALDRDFAMGPGSLRKTLLHLYDAERWWLRNWAGERVAFERTADNPSIAALSERWKSVAQARQARIGEWSDADVQRCVQVAFGGPPLQFQIVESLVQLCLHGTHHRAQLVNMLRHLDVSPPALDYVVWMRAIAAK